MGLSDLEASILRAVDEEEGPGAAVVPEKVKQKIPTELLGADPVRGEKAFRRTMDDLRERGLLDRESGDALHVTDQGRGQLHQKYGAVDAASRRDQTRQVLSILVGVAMVAAVGSAFLYWLLVAL